MRNEADAVKELCNKLEGKMGMDVYGKNPMHNVGKYFRCNVWNWRPLWTFCCDTAPNIINEETARSCHYNDGYGLSNEDSIALAKALTQSIESGTAQQHETDFRLFLQTLPKEECPRCPIIPKIDRQDCTTCQGSGSVPSYKKAYNFSVTNVKEFAQFLNNCGGFEVW